MARLFASDALLRAATATGHARAIAPQSYLERVAAEPWIRRMLPGLIAIFLSAIWLGSIYKHLGDRDNALAAAKLDLEHVSALTAIDLQIATDQVAGIAPNQSMALRMAIPPHSLEAGRQAYVTSPGGAIVAAEPLKNMGRTLEDILGTGQVLTMMADRAGVLRVTLADGTDALASVRTIDGRRSQLAFVQPVSEALKPWRSQFLTKIFLLVATSLVIGALGLAFINQSARAAQADAICAELKSRTESALASGRSGIWDWDVARGRVYWSDSMFALLGLERPGEFMSFADIAALVHPSDANLFNAANDLILAPDALIDSEFRLRHADGRWIWMRVRGERAADPETGAAHLVGIAVDISEQKALAASRATADMRVRDAIESITEAFALFDSDQRLVAANSKFQSLFGLSGDILKPGTPREEIELAACRESMYQHRLISDCKDTGSRSYELRLTDGRWLNVNERGTKDGGFVFVGSDITAHKTYEASLAGHNEVLESMVAHLEASKLSLQENSRKLSELNKLYLAEKHAAEGANRAKAEFLANMNHELRTPLNHIINFSAMMETEMYGPLGDGRYKGYAGDIGKSGVYLLGVISDILDMAAIEAGRLEFDRERVSLAVLCEEARANNDGVAASRGVEISVRVDGPLHVIGDRKALFQIIDNLVRNAVKYTRNGSVVGLRAKRQGDAIQLFFEDNGFGIADDMIERMGRPFEQVGSVIADGYKGSGLGFAISKSLAEMHGGGIRIRSKSGKGTIMMVTLPVDGPDALIKDREAA
jgi:two-component system, cell cycle sensor histidine kinase PleC